MSKVVYLLGAGASYGKRNQEEPKNSPKRIVEGLPVVNEIDNELGIVIDWVNNCDVTGAEKRYEYRGQSLDADAMKSMFIDDLTWLRDNALQHATIDTFAKKLYLCNRISDYGKLKLLLSSFFLIEQVIHPFDKRYDTFFANILNRSAKIPDNIYIMTWNYDLQLDMAYREYGNGRLYECVPHDTWTETDDARVFRINGVGNYIAAKNIESEWLLNMKKVEVLDKVFEQYCVANKLREFSDGCLQLLFAWEKYEFDKRRQILYDKIADAQVLVVIGYSFPFFNRETDREIFSKMEKLKRIYIQDPYADDIKQFISSVLTEEQRTQLYPDIVTIKNIANFYLPPEL